MINYEINFSFVGPEGQFYDFYFIMYEKLSEMRYYTWFSESVSCLAWNCLARNILLLSSPQVPKDLWWWEGNTNNVIIIPVTPSDKYLMS